MAGRIRSGWRETHFGCKIGASATTSSNSQKVLNVALGPRLRAFYSFSSLRSKPQFFATKAVSRQPLRNITLKQLTTRTSGLPSSRWLCVRTTPSRFAFKIRGGNSDQLVWLAQEIGSLRQSARRFFSYLLLVRLRKVISPTR